MLGRIFNEMKLNKIRGLVNFEGVAHIYILFFNLIFNRNLILVFSCVNDSLIFIIKLIF